MSRKRFIKRILKQGAFRLAWTTMPGEWELFLRRVVEERSEHRIWWGLRDINLEWEIYLREWMQERGEFFIGRWDSGVCGGCWVTDVNDDGVGNFHFVAFDNAPAHLFKVLAPEILKRVYDVGLDRRTFRMYKSLVGITPLLEVARLARVHGFGDYEEIKGHFDGSPGYLVNLKREN